MKNNFLFNPFSGALSDDIDKIIVPIFDLNTILSEIDKNQSIAIEFLGRQGRGKTTHLTYLQKKLNQFPIFYLNKNTNLNELLKNKSDTIFVDSIHHLNIFDRLKLFKAKKVIIYTTHYSRKVTCKLLGKKIKSIRFKGINVKTLKNILNNRLQIASKNNKINFKFSEEEIQQLITRFGDNYRGIINHLFEKFQ